MSENVEALLPVSSSEKDEIQLGVIDSRFRLIIIAGLRTKQLLHGSKPRIEVDSSRRRNTSIALEETRRGMVPFTIRNGLKGI